MRIPRIYVDLALTENTELELPEATFHYLCKVLRLKEAHPLTLFNGRGGQYHASLTQVTKRTAAVLIGAFEELNNESPIQVTIGQTLSRGERMDYAIQKAVEAGVFAIQPLFSERCEVKLHDSRIAKRLQHWQQVAISAAEQCGRGTVPIIYPPQSLVEWTGNCKEMLKLTLHHHTQKPITEMPAPADNAIAVLIGPEGGLTEEEVNHSINQGFMPIALGPRVLRTETAPVVALTAINLLWGDIR